eukprot:90454-Prymnesium_polylepis.1
MERAEALLTPRWRTSLLEGRAGLQACQIAISLRACGAEAAAAEAAALVSEEVLAAVASLPEADCELLYGRCGYLHALLSAHASLRQPSFGRTAAEATVEQI